MKERKNQKSEGKSKVRLTKKEKTFKYSKRKQDLKW